MKKLYLLGLLVTFVALATLGFQCQKVTDPASDGLSEYGNPDYAPPFSASDFDNAETCQAMCNNYYTGMLKDENEHHSEVMQGLSGNTEAVKNMRREEIERHKDAVGEIQDARHQCVRDCHDQGGVGGGF